MIVVSQEELKLKDPRALTLIMNKIINLYGFVRFDYYIISAVADILYNRFKDKKHDVILDTFVSYEGVKKPFKIRINYGRKETKEK